MFSGRPIGFNVLRCRLCDSPTDRLVISRKEKMEAVSPTKGSTDDRSTNGRHI